MLDAAERESFELCISREILEEIRRALTTKVRRMRRYYAYPDDKIDLFIEGIGAKSEIISDLPAIRVARSIRRTT